MMKKIVVLLALTIGLLSASAQNMATVIKTQAMNMARAVLNKDVEKLIIYMHPSTVKLAGGKDKILSARDSANKYMKQFGAEIKKITIGNPGPIIHYKKQLQSVLPQTTQVSFMESIITMETSLIALSDDNGKNWMFIDNSIYNIKSKDKGLPELSPDLVIPAMKPPVFKPKSEN
jgi:hypothetical protein